MIAHFYYNIPRHHGKYGLAVSVYNSVEDRIADYDECTFARCLAYIKPTNIILRTAATLKRK